MAHAAEWEVISAWPLKVHPSAIAIGDHPDAYFFKQFANTGQPRRDERSFPELAYPLQFLTRIGYGRSSDLLGAAFDGVRCFADGREIGSCQSRVDLPNSIGG